MRSTRLRKFRKKYQPLIISFKVVLVLYMVLFSVSYLTTDTVAYFNGKNVSTIMITAGTWDEEEEQEKDEADDAEVEDESSLAFVVGQETIEPLVCPTEIEIEVTNEGDGPMLTNAFYEVYFIEDGNPEKDGEKVTFEEHEGIIEILEQGHTEKLVYETSAPGFYQFVIYQDEDASEETRIWSEVMEVVCEEEVAEEVESDEVNNEQENQEEATSESEEAVENQDPIKEDKKKNKEANTDLDENAESNSEIDEQSIEDKDVESNEEEENNEVDQ